MSKRAAQWCLMTVWVALTACGGGGGGSSSGGGNTGGGETPPPLPAGWAQLSDLPRALGRFAAAEANGKIYVAGGFDTLPSFYIYDIAGNSWQTGPSLLSGTDNNGAVFHGGKLHVFGGEAAQTLQIFDTATGTWSPGPSLPSVRFASVAVALGEHAHLIGGWNYSNVSSASLATHERFNFTSQTHEPGQLAPLMQARNCAASGVIDGRIYVAGGRAPGIRDNDTNALKSVEVYVPTADGWDVRAEMPTARACAASAVVGGKLYVLGGELPAPQIHRKIERFDPVANSWETLADMPFATTGAAAVAVGNDIYLIGGYSSTTGTRPQSPSRGVYKYTPTP